MRLGMFNFRGFNVLKLSPPSPKKRGAQKCQEKYCRHEHTQKKRGGGIKGTAGTDKTDFGGLIDLRLNGIKKKKKRIVTPSRSSSSSTHQRRQCERNKNRNVHARVGLFSAVPTERPGLHILGGKQYQHGTETIADVFAVRHIVSIKMRRTTANKTNTWHWKRNQRCRKLAAVLKKTNLCLF